MVKQTKLRSRESDLVKGILDYLRLRKDVIAWRQNTGATRIGDRFIRYGLVGQPDITGIIIGGYRLDIECKVKGGRLSAEQAKYREQAKAMKSCYILAYCIEDVKAALDDFKMWRL
ncbi:MAG: hypothetical protein ACP5O7_13455 [Phycisphaerae bacterium]